MQTVELQSNSKEPEGFPASPCNPKGSRKLSATEGRAAHPPLRSTTLPWGLFAAGVECDLDPLEAGPDRVEAFGLERRIGRLGQIVAEHIV